MKTKATLSVGNIFVILICLCYSFICTLFTPSNLSAEMEKNYIVLVSSAWIYTLILSAVLIKRNVDIFEPISLVVALHLFLFVVAPIRSILVGDTIHKAGAEVFSGCIRGTMIALAVFVIMLFFYEHTKCSRLRIRIGNLQDNLFSESFSVQKACRFAYFFWIVGFVATLAYLAMRGMSFRYILTLGGSGSFEESLSTNSSYAFFSVIGNLMFAAWLFIFELSNSKLVKVVLFVLTLFSLIVRGFRVFIVIFCLAPIIFVYLKRDKRPSLKVIISVLVIGLLMIGVVGWARNAIRSNQVSSLSGFSFDDITYAFWGNFDVYKTYYGVVNAIPSQMNYTLGAQMIIYTLIMFVPRAIWPGKPQPVLRDVINYAVNGYAVKAGAAYPALGEWYHEFGIIGCLILAILTGYLLKKLCYFIKSRTIVGCVFYSIMCPSILQFVIRGYTPTNFWMGISMIIPVLFIGITCGNASYYEE